MKPPKKAPAKVAPPVLTGPAKLAEVARVIYELNRDLGKICMLPHQRDAALEQLKVYGRDSKDADPMFTNEGIETNTRHAFNSPSFTTSRCALRCLANAMLLNPSARARFVELHYEKKLCQRLKNGNQEDELLVSRIIFLTTYGGNIDIENLIDHHHLADNINHNIARHAKQYDEAHKIEEIQSDRPSYSFMKDDTDPSVVSLIHYDAVNLSLELEYIGPNLATFSDRDRMSLLPETSQNRIWRDITSGIEYMHAQNVTHLDIKPQNILLQEGGRAVLCDFDISVRGAKPVPCNAGTPWYVPPEHIFDGRRGREGDVWPFGGTMLFVTLHKEAHGKMLNWLREVRRAADAAPKNLSLVRSMLEPNPRKRITAAQLTIELAAQVSWKSSGSELVANLALLNI
ncbi:hypothetical protein VE01_04070 [Pseudogymnoascus verrucosus]|uniref:Protein kinase domain-containing protein n=1 Tax=Pseudogymnoascus verrucosus TaxID=342668 RepID=A0A1B8GLN6_9PEZI|nr:uncharacterized protein VE01_04070 [Pseudogymnoascus verrucosus]OBT96716.1 hypothetical protein VE01_04070 [Pseudogymnoascus verrucosus]